MAVGKHASKAVAKALPAARARRFPRRFIALTANSPYAYRAQQRFIRSITVVTAGAAAISFYQWANGGNPIITDVNAEAPAQERPEAESPELVFEESKYRQDATVEETRDEISSQHLQVRKSWENPGVWCWGANDGKVAAPDAKQNLIRNPRWLSFFDGKLLRDLKLTREFGAAILENGDLVQWGTAYDANATEPTITLKGKNLKSLAISADRVLALSSNGTVFSLSASQQEQLLGPKPQESSWIPFWGANSPISYRTVSPKSLSWNEKVSSIAAGLDHVVMLTSRGRVYTAAAGSESFPTRGELGVPGLTWFTRPPGPYDQAHELPALKDFKIARIAAGDHHSIALDRAGRVFAWGDNVRGQLGIGDVSKDTPHFDTPTLVAIGKLYAGTHQAPRVTGVFAGGNTTFLAVDATRVAPPNAESYEQTSRAAGVGRVSADVWACGHGIWGQLGNGRWTHVAPAPTRIAALSGLFEYDETAASAVPIRMRDISVGASHCAAVMDNVTNVDALASSSSSSSTSTPASNAIAKLTAAGGKSDTNWGADVVFFGNNEFYQLGTGKRNNLTTPTYIAPLDRRAEIVEGRRETPRRGVEEGQHRFHATPRATVRVGDRWVSFEQRIVCGRGVTAVYSGV